MKSVEVCLSNREAIKAYINHSQSSSERNATILIHTPDSGSARSSSPIAGRLKALAFFDSIDNSVLFIPRIALFYIAPTFSPSNYKCKSHIDLVRLPFTEPPRNVYAQHAWTIFKPTRVEYYTTNDVVCAASSPEKWSCGHKRQTTDAQCPVCRAFGRPPVTT